MAKRTMYSFAERRHSQKGITSSVLGIVSLLIFLLLAYVSFLFRGEGGIYLGAMGMTAMVISMVGLVYGLRSFKEKNRIYFFSKIGSILNGLILVGWIAVIANGIK